MNSSANKKPNRDRVTPERSPLNGKPPMQYLSSPETGRSTRFRPVDVESDTSGSVYGIAGPQPYLPSSKHQLIGFTSPLKYVSDTEALYRHQVNNAGSRYLSDNEVIWQPHTNGQDSSLLTARAYPATSGGVSPSYSSPAMSRRPKPVYQPPSFTSEPSTTYHKPVHQNMNGSSSSDYDIVPEFLDFSQSQHSVTSQQGKPVRFPVSNQPYQTEVRRDRNK